MDPKPTFAQRLNQMANPKRFMDLSARLMPWTGWPALVLLLAGLYMGLVTSPPDYQQGDSVRIMYVHVPAAWMSMCTYALMAAASLVGLVWRHALADVAAKAAAPLGAGFTFLALVTGSLWGKPMWGAYWVWDARLTSELVLLFLYFGYIGLWNAIEDPTRAARACAVLCLVGVVNLPVIKFSVDWWNSLHQGESIFRLGGPTIDTSMLWPLFLMTLGYTVLFAFLWMLRIRTEILERRVRQALLAKGMG